MITKKELIQQINEAASEYLKFKVELAGLNNLKKEVLIEKLADYKRMVELNNEADKIYTKYPQGHWDAMAFLPLEQFNEMAQADYSAYHRLSKEAYDIWATK